MESKPYDVVLLPEFKVAQAAIQLSKKVEQLATHFTLGNDEYFPHVSLYMLQLNVEGLGEAEVILKKVAKEADAVGGRVEDYHYEKGYFDIEYQKSTEMINLQNKIIEQMNPIRDGLRAKDEERLHTVSGEERANIERCGYRSVGNLFTPHLTFTRFKDTEITSLNDLPPKGSFEGNFISLGIFEMGDHGTCKYKVNEWVLG